VSSIWPRGRSRAAGAAGHPGRSRATALLALLGGGAAAILLAVCVKGATSRVDRLPRKGGASDSARLLPRDSTAEPRRPGPGGLPGEATPGLESGAAHLPEGTREVEILVEDALGRVVPRYGWGAWVCDGDAFLWSGSGESPGSDPITCPADLSGAATLHVWNPRDAGGNALPLLPRWVVWPDVARQPIRVTLDLARDLRGVVRTEDGEPYPETLLTARYLAGRTAEGKTRYETVMTRCGPAGEYELERVPMGPLRLWVQGQPPEAYLTLDEVPGGVGLHDVVVQRGGRWTARLLGPDGRPVPTGYAAVLASVHGVGWHAYERSSPDGTVSVAGIPRGASFDVEVGATGEDPPLAPVTLHAQRAGTWSEPIRLERGVYIRGRLVDERGDPVCNQGVYLTLDPRLPFFLWAYRDEARATDAEGRFLFGPLPDKEYWIAPVHSKPYACFEPERVRGGERELIIRVPHPATRSVRVVGTDPAQVDGWWFGRRLAVFGRPQVGGLFLFRIPDGEPGAVLFRDARTGLYAYLPLDRNGSRIEPVSLVPGERICGMVTGLPTFEGAEPVVEAMGAGVWLRTGIDASGVFELRGLPPGRYDLTVLSQPEYQGNALKPCAVVPDVVAGTTDLRIRVSSPR
jgi:hypothetical protein